MPASAQTLEVARLIGAEAAATEEALDESIAALDAAASPDNAVDRGRLALRRAELRTFAGEWDGAVEDVQVAGELLPEGSDSEVRARLLAVRLLCRSAKQERAAEILQETRGDAKGRGQPVRLALAMATGELALDKGTPRPAFDHLRRAAGIAAGRPGAEHDLWQAAMGVAVACQLMEDPLEARPWLDRAVEVATQVDDPRRRSEPAFGLGNILAAAASTGPPDQAAQMSKDAADAYEIAIEGELPAEMRPAACLALAQLQFAAGDHETAVDTAVDAGQAAAAVGNPGLFASSVVQAARAQGAMGRPQEALKTLDAGATALRRQGAAEFAKLCDTAKVDFEAPE